MFDATDVLVEEEPALAAGDEHAVDAPPVPLLSRIRTRLEPMLEAARFRPDQVDFRLVTERSRLDVYVDLPSAGTRSLAQALAVRVLDAIGSTGRTYGQVDVHVQPLADCFAPVHQEDRR